MRHAEALLLVDHEQAQVLELNVFRQETVGAHDDVDLASAQFGDHLILLRLAAEAADHVDLHGKSGETIGERLLMLEGEHGRRCEKCGLLAVHHGFERRPHRHFGLAVADVAAQQPIHRRRRFHVALDVSDGVRLIDGQFPFERVLELPLPVGVGAERVAGDRFARGIELEQLLRHVAHRLLDPGLRPLPRRAAELVERRLRGAAVLLNEVEPLDRHEQLVLAGVPQLHELLHRVADADLLQSDKLSDAVIDVDDEVADLQIAEIRQERLGNGTVPIAAPLDLVAILVEDIGFGDNLQPCALAAGTPSKAARP